MSKSVLNKDVGLDAFKTMHFGADLNTDDK